jgi:hypothetical protein
MTQGIRANDGWRGETRGTGPVLSFPDSGIRAVTTEVVAVAQGDIGDLAGIQKFGPLIRKPVILRKTLGLFDLMVHFRFLAWRFRNCRLTSQNFMQLSAFLAVCIP